MSKAGKLLSDLISNAPVASGAPIGGGGSPQPSGRSAGGNPAGAAAQQFRPWPMVAHCPLEALRRVLLRRRAAVAQMRPVTARAMRGSPGGVPSVSPSAQPSPSLGTKLGKFVQAAATRAINGIPQALSYFANTSRPAAQNLQNQWTNPMSPQDAAMMVGGAWLSEAAGAGISGGKGAYNNAVANGATPQAATQAALETGTSFFSNRAAAMASGGTAGGSIANGGLGGYGGRTVTNGMPGQRGVLVNRGGEVVEAREIQPRLVGRLLLTRATDRSATISNRTSLRICRPRSRTRSTTSTMEPSANRSRNHTYTAPGENLAAGGAGRWPSLVVGWQTGRYSRDL